MRTWGVFSVHGQEGRRLPQPRREPRERGTRTFQKPALTHDQLVDLMVSRGLRVPDRRRATRYLAHVGYFRLSPYTIPFQEVPAGNHQFTHGAEFDDVLELYVFDRALRLLVMDALERVEVAVRAAITDHMSTRYDDPHWYLDVRRFRHHNRWLALIDVVEKSVQARLTGRPEDVRPGHAEANVLYRSALEHYVVTYQEPRLPPSWLMVELLTIGELQNLYEAIAERRDRTAVARTLGLNEAVLSSWLRTYVRVRNICAHHGRLWNVGLGVYPVIPTSPDISWLRGEDTLPHRSVKRLYPVLVSLQSILDTIAPRSTWAARLHHLLANRPEMNLRGMGVPRDWALDEFWARHIETN